MLDPMPAMLIAHYNGLIIQFGWITFFAPAYPAGVAFILGVCLTDFFGEINNMVKYWKRDKPVGGVTVGTWVTYLESASQLGIVMRLAIVFFS